MIASRGKRSVTEATNLKMAVMNQILENDSDCDEASEDDEYPAPSPKKAKPVHDKSGAEGGGSSLLLSSDAAFGTVSDAASSAIAPMPTALAMPMTPTQLRTDLASTTLAVPYSLAATGVLGSLSSFLSSFDASVSPLVSENERLNKRYVLPFITLPSLAPFS